MYAEKFRLDGRVAVVTGVGAAVSAFVAWKPCSNTAPR